MCKFPNCHAWMNNGLLMEQVILGVSDVSSWLLWTFLSCKDSSIDSSKKSRVSAKFLMPYLFADVTVRGMEGYKCHRSKTTSNQQIEAEKKNMNNVNKSCVFHLQPHHVQASAHTLQRWFWKQLQNKETLKAEWKRSRTHTLVAHHQVCQTLKGNKSTVSNKQGSMGRQGCHGDKNVQWQTSCFLWDMPVS